MNTTKTVNKYNPHIHHRRSIGLKGYDYSQAGLYFITICCQNRACLFGNVVNGEMKLNDAGKIANDCWMEIPNHFPNVALHEHIVMPNHIHGIIELVGAENFPPDRNAANVVNGVNDSPPDKNAANVVNGVNDYPPDKNAANVVNGVNDYPPDKNVANVVNGANDYSPDKNVANVVNGANDYSPLRSPSKTIGSIVRGFKIGVTKWFRQNTDITIVWQRNYWEHIIRNEQSYQTISEYIVNNPAKWKGDKFYT